MNRKDRKQQIEKLAKENESNALAQKIAEIMDCQDDVNDAGGHTSGERFILELLDATRVPGLDE